MGKGTRNNRAWVLGGSLTAAILTAALMIPPMLASAFIGASSSPLTTAAPDLRTVAVSNATNQEVRYCFDQPIANFLGNAGSFHLEGYNEESLTRINATGTSIAGDSNANCAVVTFGGSVRDITLYTVGTVDWNAVYDTATTNFGNVQNAASLT